MNSLGIALLSVALIAMPTCRASDSLSPNAAELVASTPIRSEEELVRYLKETSGKDSPLNALSIGARKRFIASLQFRPGGLGGFATDDLTEALTHKQIVAVLSLFEAGKYADRLEGRNRIQAPREFESDFERRFDAFYLSFLAEPAPSATQIKLAYQQLLGGQQARDLASGLDLVDLALLYRAMLRVLREDTVSGQADQCRQVLALLHGYGEETRNQVSQLFDILVTRRQFDLAERVFVGDAKAGLNATLQVSADGRRLSRGTLDLTHGLHIVVVAGCHFAKDAAIAISAEPGLNRLFEHHAVWLAPASERISDVAQWNRELPSQPIQIAWRERDWPQIPSWNMPTFYVFRDGALLKQWSGWPADSGMADLREGLHDAGVQF